MPLLTRMWLILLAVWPLCAWSQFGGVQQPMFSPIVSPQFSPTNISDLITWLKADALVTNSSDLPASNTDPVKAWGDSGTNKYSLSTSTYPHYSTNGGPSSKPAIVWDVVSAILSKSSAVTYSQPNTFIMVIYPGSTNADCTNPNIFDAQSVNRNNLSFQGARNPVMYAGSVVTGGNGAFVTNAWQILTAYFNGASSYIRTNGVQMVAGDVGAQGCQGLTLGQSQAGASPQYTFNGIFCEFIWFNKTLSSTERSDVEGYLESKYGIALP